VRGPFVPSPPPTIFRYCLPPYGNQQFSNPAHAIGGGSGCDLLPGRRSAKHLRISPHRYRADGSSRYPSSTIAEHARQIGTQPPSNADQAGSMSCPLTCQTRRMHAGGPRMQIAPWTDQTRSLHPAGFFQRSILRRSSSTRLLTFLRDVGSTAQRNPTSICPCFIPQNVTLECASHRALCPPMPDKARKCPTARYNSTPTNQAPRPIPCVASLASIGRSASGQAVGGIPINRPRPLRLVAAFRPAMPPRCRHRVADGQIKVPPCQAAARPPTPPPKSSRYRTPHTRHIGPRGWPTWRQTSSDQRPTHSSSTERG